MVLQEPVLVRLLKLIDRIPEPPTERRRGRPPRYSERLFLKALVLMIVRRLEKVHTLLEVLAQPEMQAIRDLLTENGRFPSRRTWERRLRAVPNSLPARIGCLGRALVERLEPWREDGRAGAIDSTVLRAHGGVWHKKHREAGVVPHTSIDNAVAFRHRGRLDQVRLARLGLRLEAAPGQHRRGGLDPVGRRADPRQRGG